MSKIRYNKSKTYLLPLLTEVIHTESRFFKNLTNTFVFDNEEKYKDCIILLHEFSFKNPEYTAYEHKLTNNEYFVDLIDIDNKVAYIFKFPPEYMAEYNLFKQGKYSHYGVDAKNVIIDYFGRVFSGNLNAVNFLLQIKQILFRSEKLKQKIEKDLRVTLKHDAELTDIMDQINETFIIPNKNKDV